MDLFILLGLIALNALFALSEMSIVAANKNKLNVLAQENNPGAIEASALAQDPNKILATTQLGLTFITLFEGAFASKSFVDNLVQLLPNWLWLQEWKASIAQTVVLALITFLTLVFGEMLPKRIALSSPEKIACKLAPLAQQFIRFFAPLINILSACTNAVMRTLGLPLIRSEDVSAEDVETMLEAAGRSGLLTKSEMTIMDNVWRLDERRVGAIMTPRQNIKCIDIAQENDANIQTLINHPRLRLVVIQGGLEHVLGMAPTRQWTDYLIQQFRNGITTPKIDWTVNLTPVHGIPNSLTLIETLESFRQHKTHVGLVYNEFGQVEGIVSMSDLMDALVGEMPMVTEQEKLIFQDPNGRWLIDGLAAISDVRTALGLQDLPGVEQANYQTAGGFALWMLGRSKGRLPKEFDEFEHEGLKFQIVDIDRKNGYKIDQIMVEKI